MKRFLIGLTVVLLLLCSTLGVAAEEGSNVSPPVSEVGVQGTEGAPDAGEEGISDDGETPGNIAPLGESDADASVGETAGGRVAAFFETHVGEILSALTLVGSLILMYGYKRGFLPTLCRGLDCVTRSTESLGRQATETAQQTKLEIGSFLSSAAPLLERAEQILCVAEVLRDRTKELETRLAEAAGDRAREETLWRGVAGLLYGVFSAANLPDYAKEQLGARYAALLAAASPEESTDAGTGV